MRPEVLAKIKQLVYDGAVVMGPTPHRSPSLQNQSMADQQVQAMAAELWGNVDGVNVKSRKVGKGMIMNGLTMKEAFALINCLPDCKLPEDNQIHYGHRTTKDGEIYFVSNQTTENKIIYPEFRIVGKQPELWEATTGYIRNLPDFTRNGNTTVVPLKLAPYESVFVVFRNATKKNKVAGVEANYPTPALLADMKGPWTVQFDPTKGGPVKPVVFEILTDWSKSTDDRIKYYSGTAFYNSTFKLNKLPKSEKVIIDLGLLTAMAKVTVNGIYAGGVWTAPYMLDITNLVKKDTNDVKIEVVNTWLNRLIGDQNLPESQRTTWLTVNNIKKNDPLQASGLFGPIKILRVK